MIWNPLDIGKLAADIIGKFKADPTKKQEIEGDLAKLNEQLKMKVEDHITEEIHGRTEIIKAEMAQGDKWTKRARPAVVYSGLLFIFINYVLPTLFQYGGLKPLPTIQLPSEFWEAWKVVVSVWSVGRTLEKVGINNAMTRTITGSEKS